MQKGVTRGDSLLCPQLLLPITLIPRQRENSLRTNQSHGWGLSRQRRQDDSFSRKAQAAGAGLILFPELSVCGYPPRDLVERPSFVAQNRETAEQIAAETQGIAVICGLVTPAQAETGKSVMNSAALLQDGRVEFMQSKMLLPTYDVFDEDAQLRSRQEPATVFVLRQADGADDLRGCTGTTSISGTSGCTRIDPVEALVRAGGNFLLNISASPFWYGKRELRRDMLAAIARRHKVPVAMVNQVGGNDSLVFDGSSVVVDSDGKSSRRASRSKKTLFTSIRKA